MLPAIISPGVGTTGDTINVPGGKLPFELQTFSTACTVPKRNYNSSNLISERNSLPRPIVINSMNSHSSSRSSSSCMTILIILHHHFGVVVPARTTEFGISGDIDTCEPVPGCQPHAFVVNCAAAIRAGPSSPLLPYHIGAEGSSVYQNFARVTLHQCLRR